MASVSLSPFTAILPGFKCPSTHNASNHLKLFANAFPKPSRKRLDLIPCKASSTHQSIARRTANHHPNLWDNDFIQSLSKSCETPSYGEHQEKLIMDIKEMFNALPLHSSSADDLYQRLSMVDDVERLGIDRHFQNEIKTVLDYVYRYWNDQGIGRGRESPFVDLNTTALGFRILRLHRYGISSDVLLHLKGKYERLQYSNSQTNNEEIRSILNLFRASLISFPQDQAINDVKSFATSYLKETLQIVNDTGISREIEFNLEYCWHTNVPRLEARTYIDIYGEDDVWFAKNINKINNSKILELAKLDFNMIQSLQHQEIQVLSRWWVESGLDKLEFGRHRHVEFYFWATSGCIEPKYSTFRIGFAKLCTIITYLDDIYDTYATLDELKIFTQAIKRWELASIEGLPTFMKVVFKAFDKVLKDMAREINKNQGKDMLEYTRKNWEAYIDALLQEAEWLASGFIPSLDEYLENGKVTAGSRAVTLQPILSLDVPISNEILKEIHYPSRFDELFCLALRLRGDTRTFKVEADRGEVVSSITCYLRDHPGSNEEDAIKYINSLFDETLKQFNWEYLKPDNVPVILKESVYNLSKGLLLLYKERDGFTISNLETRNIIIKTMFERV
ncbi:hypothetical protein SUGI_0119250 [Cryptomeria japonica]|uniref:alpha pinene synthase, chloroplastic n=1 Tax=Cryptomeria japonica TaxID=3369 RepID=UPI002408A3F8|nr:alpha pinene synthase, chloroplastic [Cryptomeria japonica]GLJ09965.1 hypothetical protein SUGI_0119250 [Cryptomeria japonica]